MVQKDSRRKRKRALEADQRQSKLEEKRMSTFYRCDRCGAEIMENELERASKITIAQNGIGIKEQDLCPGCTNDYHKWFILPDSAKNYNRQGGSR